jgi:hypothetical protein
VAKTISVEPKELEQESTKTPKEIARNIFL